jgi:hypothetical protein
MSNDDSIKQIHDEIKTLRESIDNLNSKFDDISAQNRSWISSADVESKYKLEKNTLKIFFKNFGNIPATDLQMKGLVSIHDDIDQSTLDDLSFTESLAIAPSVTSEQLISSTTGNSLHFGVELEYSFDGGKKGHTVLIGHVHVTSNSGMIYSTKILN